MIRNLFAFFTVALLFSFACTKEEEAIYCDQFTPCPEGYTCDLNLSQCLKDEVAVDQNGNENDPTESDTPQTETETATENENPPTEADLEAPDYDTFCKAKAFIRCVESDEHKQIRCADDGSAEVEDDCPTGFVCKDALGCQYQMCEPGSPICDTTADPYAVYECDETGLGHLADPVETCDELAGEKCLGGQCMTLCEIKAFEKSYEGCDYFTANLRNLIQTRTDPIYSLTVSNTDDTRTAVVNITISADGTTETDAGLNYFCIDNATDCQTMTTSLGLSVPPKKLGIIRFPHDRMIPGPGISYNAYHLVSDMPVSVYQFNPFDNSNTNPFTADGLSVDAGNQFGGKPYANDASLLMPTSGLYTDYIVTSYHALSDVAPSYATVIGFNPTEIEIEVNSPVALSGDFGNGVNNIPANAWTTLKLKRFQTIQLEGPTNSSDKGPDITGTRIRCKTPDSATCAPFVVFGGHVCANVPAERSYCDHLEHQMFPVQIWGKQYIIVKTMPRGDTDFDMVRIVASEDGTEIGYTPFLPTALQGITTWDASQFLNAQQWTEFYIQQPLFITSNKPIMVAQYITGSEMISAACMSTHGEQCVGDPAMMVIPPIEQYRENYIFLTPGSYVSNFATIVKPKNIVATLNGTVVSDFIDIAGTGYQFSIAQLGSEFKRHELTCPGGCGLFVYGWEQDVSYAYPGGLMLKDISEH